MLVTKQLMAAIDFHCIFFRTMEVNGYRQQLILYLTEEIHSYQLVFMRVGKW